MLDHRAPHVRQYAASTVVDGRRRAAASKGPQEKKYINVAAGGGRDAKLDQITEELTAMGYVAAKVPGPLLLSTTGGMAPKRKIMPFGVGSASGPAVEMLQAAHKAANQNPLDPDPDLDLDARREPRWATHSLRRLADTCARRYREVSGATEAQIDIYFGWQERLLKKAMQTHYEPLSIRARMALAKITGWL